MGLRTALFLAWLLVGSVPALAVEPSPAEVLATVQRFLPSARAFPRPAGSSQPFTGASLRHPAVEERIGQLPNGDALHLFPDGSYLYLRFGDILPATIFDRGYWRYDGSCVRLVSDGTLPREHAVSGSLLPFVATIGGTERLFLLGLAAAYPQLRA